MKMLIDVLNLERKLQKRKFDNYIVLDYLIILKTIVGEERRW